MLYYELFVRKGKLMNGAKLLVKSLEKNEVKYIFGIPGDTKGKKAVSETFIFRELQKSKKINFIRTTHEQNAGFMADLYGRVSGDPGVCYTTLGPGATNISTALATAHLDRSPVVCLSSQLPRELWHEDTHQYIPMAQEFGHKTKLQLTINKASEIPEKIDLAFEVARAERPGVVHVELPVDTMEEELVRAVWSRDFPKLAIKGADEQLILNELKKASLPLLLIGASVMRQRAGREILKFMERYHLYALSTFHGKGAIPPTHPLYLGVMSRHLAQTGAILQTVDLLLNIGYDYAEGITSKIWGQGKAKRVVNIDAAPKTGGKFYQPDLEIIDNLKDYFSRLNKVARVRRPFPELAIKKFTIDELKFKKNTFPVNPLSFVEKLSKVLEKDDIVIVDVGEHKQVMGLFFEAPSPKSIFFSNGHSTLGYALPGGLGASFAAPNKRIIIVVGDGGFQLTSSEFITAVSHKIPIKVLILNDNAYGIIKYEQEKAFGDHYGVEFKNPDFVKLAEAYGGVGLRVSASNGLLPTLRKALTNNKPTIVDIPITYRNKLW